MLPYATDAERRETDANNNFSAAHRSQRLLHEPSLVLEAKGDRCYLGRYGAARRIGVA